MNMMLDQYDTSGDIFVAYLLSLKLSSVSCSSVTMSIATRQFG